VKGNILAKKLLGIAIMMLSLYGCVTSSVVKQDNSVYQREYRTSSYIGPKKKLAVATFTNNTRFGERRMGDNIATALTTELDKSNRFILLERNKIDEVVNQISLSQTGLTEGKLENAKLQDADYIITGAVTRYSVTTTGNSNLLTQSKTQKADVAVDIRIVDVTSGEIILSETGTGIATRELGRVLGMGASGGYDETLEGDAFRAAIIKLMENIIITLDKREWICNVVKSSSEKLYLDAGKKSNLTPGTTLKLYTLGAEIRDLGGKLLGNEESYAGDIRVIDYLGENGSIATWVEAKNIALPAICKLKQ